MEVVFALLLLSILLTILSEAFSPHRLFPIGTMILSGIIMVSLTAAFILSVVYFYHLMAITVTTVVISILLSLAFLVFIIVIRQ